MSGSATATSNSLPELEIRPLANALGAEICGLEIGPAMAPATVDAIRHAWHKYHVLLFRGVNWTPQEHMAFSRQFGELDRHEATPLDRHEDFPELLHITNREKNGKPSDTRTAGRNWHSDYSYTPRPAAASMLYCVEKPSVGGDTMFCNMARAYAELSPKYRAFLDGLHSVYDISLVAGLDQRSAESIAKLHKINPPIAHPTVRVHPESGVKALYVSERASHFDGMSRAESEPIIRYLCDFATRHENVYRHQWQPRDLVCWDNRTTMHIALADFEPSEPRTMLRTTLRGQPSGYLVN